MYRVFCVLILFELVVANHDLSCPPGTGSSTTARLKGALLCDYDPTIRGVKDHRNVTTVSFRLLLKYFNYDHFTHTLSVDTWFPTYWVDQHLKWKPEEYEGIKTVHFSPALDIWAPDISVYNRKDQSTDPKIIGDTTCAINFKGTVFCVPAIRFEALCVPDLKKYPYDVQKCTIRLGSWVHKGEELNFVTLNPLIDIEDLEPNGEWDLVSFKGIHHRGNYSCCPNNTYPSVDVILEMKRHSTAHTINAVIPLLVCMLLTLSTMAMSPLNKERLILGCVNLLAHIYHIQNISYVVPTSGENMPNLLSISRDSTLLAAISVVATIFLKYLMQSQNPSPSWMSGTVAFLINSRPGQMILLSDNSLKGVATAENKEDAVTIISNSELPTTAGDWTVFGKFLDILLFITYIIVHFILFLSF